MNFAILLAVSETASLTLAIMIIVAICVVMIIAMFKFDVDGALKVWGALGTLTGLVVGSMATFFFSEKSRQEVLARKDAEQASLAARGEALTAQLKAADTEKTKLQSDLVKLTTKDGKNITPVFVVAQDWLRANKRGETMASWNAATMNEDGTWKFGEKKYEPGDAILITPAANPEKK
jgi:hypothetical protein